MDVLIVLLLFVSALVFCLIGGYSLTWVLALTFVALPYACYLYLIPLCWFFTKPLFFPKKQATR